MNLLMVIKRQVLAPVFIGLLLLTCLSSGHAQSVIEVSGTSTGSVTWSADTVKVTGNITVDSLIIQPGTIVEFQGNYKLTINRYLAANGEAGDTILFTINDTTGLSNRESEFGGWGGIFSGAEITLITLNYCKIQYVKDRYFVSGTFFNSGAIWGDFGDVYILNSNITNNFTHGLHVHRSKSLFIYKSLIADNKGKALDVYYSKVKIEESIIRNNLLSGIYVNESSLTIEKSVIELNRVGIYGSEGRYYIKANTIQNNLGVGIHCQFFGTKVIEDNIIRNNGGDGLNLMSMHDKVHITNNLIYNNNGYGIEAAVCLGTMLANNTITNNSDGGISAYHFYGHIVNCIIRNNGGKQIISNESNVINIYNTNIEGFTADSTDGEFIKNMDLDPKFEDTANFDFHLSDYSPSINAGMSDTTGLALPLTDLDGNMRIFDGRIDMGAYEYQQDNFHILKQPVSQTLCEGTALTFETEAIGGVLGYQWQKNGTNLTDLTRATLHIGSVSMADTGHYNCLIIADDKTVSTDTIILSVEPDFEIADQTVSFSICPGQDTLLYVSAKGYRTIDYAWFKNDELLADAGDSVLVITGPQAQQQDGYHCTLTNVCKSQVSPGIVVSAKVLPVITMSDTCSACKNDTLIIEAGGGFVAYLWNTGDNTEKIDVTNAAGTYYVTVTSLDGCSASDSTNVVIQELPALELPADTTINAGETLQIDAGDGYQTYKWNTGSENKVLTLTGLTPGTYKYNVQVSDQNNCFAVDSIQVTIVILSSIHEKDDQADVKIYPNPARGSLNLGTSVALDEEVLITITDNTGKIVLQRKFEKLSANAEYPMDVSLLNAGIYLLKITGKTVSKVEKVLIK